MLRIYLDHFSVKLRLGRDRGVFAAFLNDDNPSTTNCKNHHASAKYSLWMDPAPLVELKINSLILSSAQLRYPKRQRLWLGHCHQLEDYEGADPS